MNEINKNVIRRLLRGATLTLLYKENKCVIGYFGKNPLDIEVKLAKYLIDMECVELDSGNDHYQEENYLASEKLKGLVWEMGFMLGDTVEFEHLIFGRRKGVITEECDPLGLNVCIGGVNNIRYFTGKSLYGKVRTVLTEKKILDYEMDVETPPYVRWEPGLPILGRTPR